MFWFLSTIVVLLVFVAILLVALVSWAQLAIGALNSISELLLQQHRWPAANITLKSGFKMDNSERPN